MREQHSREPTASIKSAPFDHAADTYDERRGFPPGISDLVADAAAEIVRPGTRVLEVGVGTGRIAKPLLARGFHVTGIDLSPKMMRWLLATLPSDVSRPALVEADAAQLPLTSGVFDAVVSVHVFHLVVHWHEALAEVRRTLKRDGVLLIGYEWRPPDSPGALILKKWREIVRARGLDGDLPGVRDFDDVQAALLDVRAAMDERMVGEWTTTRTLARHIETIEHRTWSSSGAAPEGFFPQCLARLRDWAMNEFGALEQEFTVQHRFVWQRFRWE